MTHSKAELMRWTKNELADEVRRLQTKLAIDVAGRAIICEKDARPDFYVFEIEAEDGVCSDTFAVLADDMPDDFDFDDLSESVYEWMASNATQLCSFPFVGEDIDRGHGIGFKAIPVTRCRIVQTMQETPYT